MRPHVVGRERRAFTLIELLVVMIIIAIVIAIVIPAIGGARKVARNASTQMLMKDVSTAISSFINDHERMPGYFTAREMGHQQNEGRGFTAMQNAMLDLAGGIPEAGGGGPGMGGSLWQVGPQSTGTIGVDPDLIGVPSGDNKSYFVPPGRQYIAQNGVDGGLQAASVQEHRNLPSLVDAFGNPVLLWVEDDSATGPIIPVGRPNDPGVRMAWVNSGNLSEPARFYWASNSGFLNSTQLGRGGNDQTTPLPGKTSLIGGGVGNDNVIAHRLYALLGSPTYALDTDNASDIRPSAARGRFVLHSAGPDGYFLGSQDRGGRQWLSYSQQNLYSHGWYNTAGQRRTDGNNNNVTIDLVEDFDDLITAGGG